MIYLSKEEAQELFSEEELEGYELIEKGEWDDQGKYQYCEVIFKKEGAPEFYAFMVQRSGSYFSDYDYDIDWSDPKVYEVEKKTITKEIWVVK